VSIVASENRGSIFGAADLLNKPVSREELCSVLRRNVASGKGKVLVVDDSEDARQIMSEYLADEQATIDTAANGQEALRKLETFSPDLVILDLMMPVMDGMTFLDTIRRDPKHVSLPVVVTTAKELTVQEVRQLENSVSVVLRKGVDLRGALAQVVRTLLRRAPKRSAPVAPSKPRIPVKVRKILADMVPGFLDARRKEIAAIQEALGKNEFEPIRVMGHNMKGVGSSYGFPPITEIGRKIEDAAGDEVARGNPAADGKPDRLSGSRRHHHRVGPGPQRAARRSPMMRQRDLIAARTSDIDEKRSSGLIAIIRLSSSTPSGGTPARSLRGFATRPSTILLMRSNIERDSKARVPVRSSESTTPRA
jgi:CheY-like chemotaxis protein/HPt (histidine-containing phosphotransfer) domain-containing protein